MVSSATPFVAFIALLWLPESPIWLVRCKNDIEGAKMAISRLNRNVMAFAEEVCRFAHLKYALTIHVFAYTEHPCNLLYFSLKVA